MSLLQSLRSVRIMGIALFDVVTAYLGLFLLFGLSRQHGTRQQNALLAAVFVLPIGILTHLAFGIPTMLNYDLGLSEYPRASL